MNLLLAHRLLRAERPSLHGLSAGAVVEPFEGATLAGDRLLVNYAEAVPTVLYYFSPTCSWCERNWSNVRSLVRQTKGRYRFVGVSMSPVKPAFMRERQLDFEVASGITADVAKRYVFGGTPQTIVVSVDRRVLQTWAGAYSGLQGQEIAAYFGVQLPGLSSTVVATHRP